MKAYKLGFEFYAIFVLLLFVPASAVAVWLDTLLLRAPKPISDLALSRTIEAPTTMALLALLFFLYERYVWQIPLVRRLHDIPNINGRYEGYVETSFDGKKYPIVIEIKQGLLAQRVCVYSERSSSFSVLSAIGRNERDNQAIAYSYRNQPRTVTTDLDLRAHDGYATLEIFDCGSRLDGNYFTDQRERQRFGRILCDRVSVALKGHL